MRVVATGQFQGEEVEVTWSEDDFLDGPRDVVLAIVDESADMTGMVMGDPLMYTIDSGYLEHHFGFARVAQRVLDNAQFSYPDGEPEGIPESPPGFVA